MIIFVNLQHRVLFIVLIMHLYPLRLQYFKTVLIKLQTCVGLRNSETFLLIKALYSCTHLDKF